ncbi:MAG TPA: hypothetical protein VMV92_09140 [Streptosporangiaceae bacterium]|nr:hypothetical protein [Streptosporangiaceae bacterium]HVB45304.1 hypothetical protein [Streptosporangiaceae bacterium]
MLVVLTTGRTSYRQAASSLGLTTSTDPGLVSAAFGIRPRAATRYPADHVDSTRLPEALSPPR